MTVVLFGGLTLGFGIEVLPWLIVQAIVGFSLLEVVNYLEHYGLLRQKEVKDGKERYERCLPEHSWNSNNVASNVFLYHLQRHSDHHANPVRRYQALRHYDEVPELPVGLRDDDRARLRDRRSGGGSWTRRCSPTTSGDVDPRQRPAAQARAAAREVRRARLARDPGAAPGGRATSRSAADDGAAPSTAARAAATSTPRSAGAPREGFPAGTPWSEVPDDWACPDCGVREKADFEPVAGEPAWRPP